MSGWHHHRAAVVVTAAVAAIALVVAGLLWVTVDTHPTASDGPSASTSATPSTTPPEPGASPTAGGDVDVSDTLIVAPDEPEDTPGAWTAADPSLEAEPAELVAEAAPDAGADAALRVVSVVERDSGPEVVVEEVRGPAAAEDSLAEAQEGEDVLAVAVDTRVSLDRAAVPALLPGALATTDPERSRQWALDRLGAEGLWQEYSSGQGTVVAVVDTGVDGSHPDLVGRLTGGNDYVAAQGGNGWVDPHGHGTHVTGVIVAVRDNGLGVVGLAPKAQVMPMRVLDAEGIGWTSDIAQAIIDAADAGADVINLSLGGPSEDSSTRVAVDYAMAEGVIVVAAAGNDRARENLPSYPAALPGVVAVASTESDDLSSSFSNTGDYIDVAAPGGRILSTIPGGYGSMSGTSMATPYVAATAALAVDVTGGTVTPQQFDTTLGTTATDLGTTGWDPEFGFGLIGPAPLLCSLSACAQVESPTATASPTQSPEPTTSAAPTPTTSPGPTSSPTSSTPTPAPGASQPPATTSPAPRARPRLVFVSRGGRAVRGQRVPIRVRAVDLRTNKPLARHRVLIRGWRKPGIVVRRWVVTNGKGRARTRIPLRAPTRFDLRAPATATSQAATSRQSIRWRVRRR